ncbi:AAA family ATPase [Salinivibrio costicola]|uniref:AAA family ATPase n=1 Tax=Salinivibrio costicola TaxID=51367 RepID=A0ABX6K406_SALCS|nr:AAA family ATPase [Salinivibrio costicola]QIR06280.1 AAA family ATPase [Salinivibrio costicola]
MLFKKIEICNVGPISSLGIELPKEGNAPKPLIIVGENGSGKSILLSHLVNTLIIGKQEVYEDVEIEKGKVFKYRSPNYIKSGEYYSFSSVEFESGEKVQEWQLSLSRSDFEEKLGYTPLKQEWNQIPAQENSHFAFSFRGNAGNTKKIFKQQCCLYFPVNRFEEPAWLNLENLNSKASYTDLKRISGYSNRDIICTSPLKKNINWLLDLIFDRQAFDIKTQQLNLPIQGQLNTHKIPVFAGYEGQSSNIYEAVLQVVRVILNEAGNIRFGVGTRQNRIISVMKDEQPWVPNLFQLSTGEVQLINLFISIIRDYDLSEGELNTLSDIKGIVIIDEIDAHLHAVHQKEVLPKLIKSFPNVQFIVTSHAPLFLLGMEQEFGEDGFEILNMPNGEKLAANDFSEFVAAYDAFKETASHREEIASEIKQHAKPVVFVEGDYDIRYLVKAADVLGKKDVLERIQLKDGVGFGNLDKIWKSYNNSISEVVPNKVVLLYDCDTNKHNSQKNRVFKRVLTTNEDSPISVGIENLFPKETIDRIEREKPQYIDFKEASSKRVRGVESSIPASKSVNKDEKGNMCNWLCENGTRDDFSRFIIAFDIIEEIING